MSKHDALPAQEQQKQRAGQGRPIFGIELQVVDVDGEPLPRDGQSRGVSAGQRALGGRAYYGQDASALTWRQAGLIPVISVRSTPMVIW
ncbi:hypothetical protein LNQ03_07435 [Klebsiella pneumoniae subsp. pneumoniae]|nr:hypothetical protein [Klebsiella pneumoniae subsp. pneumoniae]